MSSDSSVDPFAPSPKASKRRREDTPAKASKRPDQRDQKPKFPTASFEEVQLPPISSDYPMAADEWVYFDVGPAPNAIRRQLHKEAVCIHCKTFRNAFESDMVEGQTKVYALPETNMRTFMLFQQWVYSQTFNLSQLAAGYEPDNMTDAEREAEDHTLAELWVFGDAYLIPILQNAAMASMIDLSWSYHKIPSMDLMNYIYDHTMEGSALRTHVVQLYVLHGGTEVFDDCKDYQPAMLADLCRKSAALLKVNFYPRGFEDADVEGCYVDE
ncbi:hypothetical protein IFR05_000621 [Cadophora sp. M221]|nr:hypothetical protein IFR05_000621 [Cadophora sp. M221]